MQRRLTRPVSVSCLCAANLNLRCARSIKRCSPHLHELRWRVSVADGRWRMSLHGKAWIGLSGNWLQQSRLHQCVAVDREASQPAAVIRRHANETSEQRRGKLSETAGPVGCGRSIMTLRSTGRMQGVDTGSPLDSAAATSSRWRRLANYIE